MPDIDAFHLPAGVPRQPRVQIASHGDVRLFAPALTPADVQAIGLRLTEAAARLQAMPVDRVVTAIDSAARCILDADHPARARVLTALTAITGYSPPMAAHVLDRMARDWLEPSLRQLLHSELGSVDAGTGSPDSDRRAGGTRRVATAPALGFHVFSGNVPGVNVTSIVRALLVRSAVLGKSAAAEPVLAPAFAELLQQADPDVGACVAVTYWQGGEASLEAAAMHYADVVVHYGDAAAIESLRSRAAPHISFVDHGPRISFAVLHADGAAGSLDEAAADLAYATAVFDQQGCVSPQIAYVIGSRAQMRDLAERAARALEDIAGQLPRGRIDAGEAAAIRELRTRAEFAAISGDDVQLWAGDSLAWSVIATDDPRFEGTCLNRTLLVKPASSIEDVAAHARPAAAFLQTVGLAGFDAEGRDHAARALARIGVTRIAHIRDMPWPPMTWHHDGRGPLVELLRWVDIEP